MVPAGDPSSALPFKKDFERNETVLEKLSAALAMVTDEVLIALASAVTKANFRKAEGNEIGPNIWSLSQGAINVRRRKGAQTPIRLRP
jgi:hypothetical protein